MEMDRMFSSLGQMQEQNEENLLSRAYWYLYLFRRHQFRWNLVMLMVMSACPCRWVTSMPCMPFVLNDSQIKTEQCDLTNQAVCFLLLFSGGIMVDCVATRCITVETCISELRIDSFQRLFCLFSAWEGAWRLVLVPLFTDLIVISHSRSHSVSRGDYSMILSFSISYSATFHVFQMV